MSANIYIYNSTAFFTLLAIIAIIIIEIVLFLQLYTMIQNFAVDPKAAGKPLGRGILSAVRALYYYCTSRPYLRSLDWGGRLPQSAEA